MSNYYEEDVLEDNNYNSEGHDLEISTLDYEKIDLEYQRGKENNNEKSKRPLEEQNGQDNLIEFHKKIKFNSSEDILNKKESSNGGKNENDKEEDIKEDDDFLTCPICLENYNNKTLLNPCYRVYYIISFSINYFIIF